MNSALSRLPKDLFEPVIVGLLLKTIISILMPNLVKEVEMEAVFHPVHALWTEVIVGRLEGQLQLLVPRWVGS